jgi:hypothetical protein
VVKEKGRWTAGTAQENIGSEHVCGCTFRRVGFPFFLFGDFELRPVV